jgi:GNAT superfamily N-acetyltransferase
VIRRATAEDVDEMAAVFRLSFRSIGGLPELHTPEEDRDHYARLVREHEAWVEDDDGIVGLAVLKGDELDALYVVPGHQRSGVGSRLFATVTEQRPAGFTFWVFQHNDRARRFYERHGCRAVKFTDGAGNEERTPDVLYEWRPPPVDGS